MGLNKTSGNMYDFVTHTWNTIKGKCPHDCLYCYMKRWGEQNPVRFDERELRTDLGEGRVIFVGSSCDMFAVGIPNDWIYRTLGHCAKYSENTYYLQSKDPIRMKSCFRDYGVGNLDLDIIVCATLETNLWYKNIMGDTRSPEERAWGMRLLNYPKHVTIEPVLSFDLVPFVKMIREIVPVQVNIGADSGGHGLPEPEPHKLKNLIRALEVFTKVHCKKNLSRLLRE